MNNKYHIDVSPEENVLFRDKLVQNNKNKKAEYSLFKNWIFWSVLVVHLGIFSIFAVASPKKETTQQEPPTIQEPTPTPAPTNAVPMDSKPEPLAEIKPPTPEVKPSPVKPEIKNQMTKEYVVKSGDTIFSIAKKYKLNYDRLIKMNNIQDPNKVVVGQKLRFL
jgi:LysM repeat protein